jgi:iron complex transport system substrate-binding protein
VVAKRADSDQPAPRRVVSLLAAGTELVCALGAGDRLVGRSHECDTPDWVERLPAVSRPTFDTTGSSDDIDRLVKEKIRAGQPLYEVDPDLLDALTPDLLITQSHCDVCAVTPADVERGSGCAHHVVSLRASTVEGTLDGFLAVAEVLGERASGDRLVARLRSRMTETEAKVRARPPVRVVCLEWISPLFSLGNWGPELVRRGGGECLVSHDGERSGPIGWDDLRRADPDALIVAPCGFDLDRTMGEMAALEARPGWRALRAVRAGRVFVADGLRFFNRSGPGVFETVEVVAEMLHPETFPPTREGRAWRRYEPATA